MSSSNKQTAGTSPPTPVSEPVSAQLVIEPDAAAVASQLTPLNPIPLPSLPSSALPVNLQVSTTVDPSISFQAADDKDVIEPEWINKAKAIVSSTRDDPYKQSEELTVFKADYMQKRYNKTVKLK